MRETGSVKMWVLAFVVLTGVSFGGLLLIGCALGANACPFSKPKPVTATDGKTLWESQCMACHGARGEGTRNAPSLIAGERGSLTLEQLKAKIARGRPLAAMPAFKRILSPQQIDAVARYVLTLREAS